MVGIYKYTNKQNNKVYIGRSTDITKRKWAHLNQPSPYSYFDQELHKLGEKAFTFEVIEECESQKLREREKYWIEYYESYSSKEKGYNLTRGGEEYKSEENPWAKLIEKEVLEIIEKLKNTKLSIQEITKQHKVHYNTISDINRCNTWIWLHHYKKNIRIETQGSVCRGELGTNKITEEKAKYIITLLEKDPRSLAQISRDEDISLNILYDINRCRTWKYLHNYRANVRNEFRKR